jgi:2-polyprenyl-3-methyl-5-hydroxy-6-metoxy-1,4-benzoquinol methylase
LRYSPEGRVKKVKIKGLFWNFVVQSSFRIPVLGYFFRLTVGIVNLPVIIRNLNTLEANTFAQLQAQHNHINTLADTAQFKINELIDKHGQVGPVLDQKANRDELAELNEKKIDREELIELNEAKTDVNDLMALNEKKANRDELGQLKEEVEGVLEQKANRDELAELNEKKIDREELIELNEAKADVNDLMALNEKKANRDELGQLKEEVEGVLERKADKEQIEPIKNEISEILRQTRDNKLNILDQQRRLTLLLEEARKRLPEPISTDQIKKMLTEEDHLLDLYVAFEDEFRGTCEDIKERVKVYIPMIKEAKAGTSKRPILDIGCGRGEWLEVLKEEGFEAQGVDSNRVLVEQCHSLGLKVVEDDVLSYLRELPDRSLGALTGLHLIEHLPFKTLIKLFDESMRTLKPGGMIIFETPNPDNILVACRNFYMDPSHQKPLPSPMLQMFSEARGFVNTRILNLHPVAEYDRQENVEGELSRLLYGPQDYALIGYKA